MNSKIVKLTIDIINRFIVDKYKVNFDSSMILVKTEKPSEYQTQNLCCYGKYFVIDFKVNIFKMVWQRGAIIHTLKLNSWQLNFNHFF